MVIQLLRVACFWEALHMVYDLSLGSWPYFFCSWLLYFSTACWLLTQSVPSPFMILGMEVILLSEWYFVVKMQDLPWCSKLSLHSRRQHKFYHTRYKLVFWVLSSECLTESLAPNINFKPQGFCSVAVRWNTQSCIDVTPTCICIHTPVLEVYDIEDT